jgi:hypothetical protein
MCGAAVAEHSGAWAAVDPPSEERGTSHDTTHVSVGDGRGSEGVAADDGKSRNRAVPAITCTSTHLLPACFEDSLTSQPPPASIRFYSVANLPQQLERRRRAYGALSVRRRAARGRNRCREQPQHVCC